MKVLHIFDFDDTLIQSKTKVIVTHANGSKTSLDSSQYAKYMKLPDDYMDYSEFNKFPINAKIIKDVFRELMSAIRSDGFSSVVVLTARSNIKPVEKFFESIGLNGIFVYGTGSSDPMAKAEFILNKVKSENFNMVRVFEDNAKNIRVIKKVILSGGGIKLKTHKVVNGRINS